MSIRSQRRGWGTMVLVISGRSWCATAPLAFHVFMELVGSVMDSLIMYPCPPCDSFSQSPC